MGSKIFLSYLLIKKKNMEYQRAIQLKKFKILHEYYMILRPKVIY